MNSKLHSERSKLTNCVGEKSDKNDILAIVHAILRNSSTLYDRYYCIDCVQLLSDNCRSHSVQEVTALIEALRILEKYGKNLLRPDRPSYWRVVRLSNPYFQQKVDNIRGSRLILKQLGYSDEVNDGLAFPQSVAIPDKQVVQLVTSDVILLKYELAMFLNKQHPSPQAIMLHLQIRDFRVRSPSSSAKANVKEEDRPCTSGIGKKSVSYQKSVSIETQKSVSSKTATSASVESPHFFPVTTDCQMCGQKLSNVYCPTCDMQLCTSCDAMWHLNRDRASHERLPMQAPHTKTSLHNASKLKTSLSPSCLGSSTHVQEKSKTSHTSFLAEATKNDEIDKNYSSAKPLPVTKNSNFIPEAHLNWEERFEMIKKKLHALTDSHSQRLVVENFCKEVDEQVKKYTYEANGLGHLVLVQQHFQQRGQQLLEKKFELQKYLTDLITSHQSDVPWDCKSKSPEAMKRPVFQPTNDATDTISSYSANSFPIMQPPKSEETVKPVWPPQIEKTTNVNIECAVGRHPVENVVEPMNVSLAPSGDSALDPAINCQKTSITDVIRHDHLSPTSNVGGKLTSVPPEISNAKTTNQIVSLKKENYRIACLKTIYNLRVAEEKNVTPIEMQIALREMEKSSNVNMSVHSWASENLNHRIGCILQHYPSITYTEACKLYQENDGDLELTQQAIKIQHSTKIEMLTQSRLCSEADAIEYLKNNNGDCFKTLIDLQKPLLQKFVERVQIPSKENFVVRDFSAIKESDHLKDALVAILSFRETVVVEMMSSIMLKCFCDEDSQSELLTAVMEYDVCDIYEAAKSFPDDISSALKYLGNRCNVCYDMYSQNKLECMTACGDNGCAYCHECLAKFLELAIRERHIRDLVCPICKLPDIDHDDEAATTHFGYLDAVIKKYLDENTYSMYQKKLTHQALMKMPNFRWCSHCENGFVYEIHANSPKMVCSACHQPTCFNCKKKWEDQHEGISCQAFLEWKQLNDEDFQAKGLAAHLKENGIDCPSCNNRYDLAKGGCMHFRCITCSYQFCSGCKSPFKQGQVCTVLRNCSMKGLHAHHPRDCLFYLRDLEVERLQKILADAQIVYDTKPQHNHNFCQVQEQKETSEGLLDEVCGRQVLENNADLCELHYKEYLVNLINDNHLDPATVFTIAELETCLLRSDIPKPINNPQLSEENYRTALLEAVKKLPLIHERQLRNADIGEALRNFVEM